jgi:hypothetical protein
MEVVVAVWAMAWIAGSVLAATAAVEAGVMRLRVEEAVTQAASMAAEQVTGGNNPPSSLKVDGVDCQVQVVRLTGGSTPVVHITATAEEATSELWLVSGAPPSG